MRSSTATTPILGFLRRPLPEQIQGAAARHGTEEQRLLGTSWRSSGCSARHGGVAGATRLVDAATTTCNLFTVACNLLDLMPEPQSQRVATHRLPEETRDPEMSRSPWRRGLHVQHNLLNLAGG